MGGKYVSKIIIVKDNCCILKKVDGNEFIRRKGQKKKLDHNHTFPKLYRDRR